MRVLLDSDVLIDVALKRVPFFEAASEVIRWAEDNPGQAAVAWHTLSNIFYIVRSDMRPFIRNLLEFVEVASIETRQAKQALGFPMTDFEDAMQTAAALAFDAHYIVSRNLRHYHKSAVPAISPRQFLREVGRK